MIMYSKKVKSYRLEMCRCYHTYFLMVILLAGDVELNPGPYSAKLLAQLVTELAEVQNEYWKFGVQLEIALNQIEIFELDYCNNSGRIFHAMLDYFLNNTCEKLWFIKICSALKVMEKNELAFNIEAKFWPQAIAIVSEDMTTSHVKYTVSFKALDPDDTNTSELKADTMKIIEEFSKIRIGFYKYLKTNMDAVNELRWVVKDWIHCGTIEKNDRFQYVTRDTLEDIKFGNLWSIFSSYCSFFNFRLLEQAVIVSDYECGITMMDKYKVKFAEYIKRRVTQCPSNIGMEGDNHVELLVKLDKPYGNCRMEHLQQLSEDICDIFKAEPKKLQLEGVQSGCICVIFHLHRSAIPNGFSLTDNQIKALKCLRYDEAKILWLKCESSDIEMDLLINNDDSSVDELDSKTIEEAKYTIALHQFEEICEKMLSMFTIDSHIHVSACNGDFESLRTLLNSAHYFPTETDENGNAAVHCAAMRGHFSIVKYLIEESKIDHSAVNAQQCSLLHLAAGNGNLELVEYLIKKNLDPLITDLHGWTPVHYATAAGHLKVVRMMLKSQGVSRYLKEICIYYKGIKYNIYHVAIGQGYLNLSKYFVTQEEHNIEDYLLLVLSVNHFVILKHLFHYFTFSWSSRQCALFAAAYIGSTRSAIFLTRFHNCDPSIKNSDGNTPLHIAACYGHILIVKFFIEEENVSANIKGQYNWTPLHSACSMGHLTIIKYLIESHSANTMQRSLYNSTPLHIASFHGHLQVLKYFIEDLHCDPTIAGENNWTILHCACRNGHIEVIDYLITNNHIDPMVGSTGKVAPIHVAAFNGRLKVIKYFVENLGIDSYVRNENGWTALHYASQKGHLNVIKYLVENKHIDAMVEDLLNATPLHIASLHGKLHIIKYYVEELHQDPSKRGECGRTSLHYTCQNGHLGVARYLAHTCHVSPLIPDSYNSSSVHIAARHGNLQLIKYFIKEHQCNPNTKDRSGVTLLHTASQYGHLNVVQFLVGLTDINIYAKNCNDDTPIHVAVVKCRSKIVKFFIEKLKFDLSVTGEHGNTLLHSASESGCLTMVKYLIESCSFDTTIKNALGNAPVHTAAYRGNLEVVKYFIEVTRCYPDIRGSDGQTPLHMAVSGGRLEVIKYLIEFQNCHPMTKDDFNCTSLDVAIAVSFAEIINYFMEFLSDSLRCEKSSLVNHNSSIATSLDYEQVMSLSTVTQRDRVTAQDIFYELSTPIEQTWVIYNDTQDECCEIEQGNFKDETELQ